jgi:hypothetical protein
MNGWGVLALLGSLAACTADKGETETDGVGSSGTDSVSTTTPTSGSGTSGGTSGGTSSDVTGAPTTTDATSDGTTGGGAGECNPRTQDCPEGLKCTAYLKPPGVGWNANQCVPEPADGGVAGDPCDVMGTDVFTGMDNCAKGYICLNTDPDGKNGACVEFCTVDDTCPNTTGGSGICNVANEGVLPICLPTCDPLVQDCPAKQGCYGDPEGPPFICFGPDPKDGGQDGSKCDFTNACLPGLQCQDSATLEGCPADSAGCCTPFCPLDGMECTGMEVCTAFFAEPFPGYENVGICVLPG